MLIEDTDDIWNGPLLQRDDDDYLFYQCIRWPWLFKYVYPDTTVKYIDSSGYYCEDINTPGVLYYDCSPALASILCDYLIVTLPYQPSDDNKIKVICENFYFHGRYINNYNTFRIFQIEKPNGEVVDINKFFKESPNYEEVFVEISEEEYYERRNRK